MRCTRRRVLGGSLLATAALIARPSIARGARPRVVIVGGGVGGATATRYLAEEARGAIEIVLIEPRAVYRTCFFQNLTIAGLATSSGLDHSYDALARDFSIEVVRDRIVGIDAGRRHVKLSRSTEVSYDRLLVSPGVEFRPGAIAGYTDEAEKIMPHAWHGGQPIEALVARLRSMRPGGTFALVAPPDPYRCPPGPYERASMIAALFSAINPRAKILIIDEKDAFSKQSLFEDGWRRHYGAMIEWMPRSFHGGVSAVDAAAGRIITEARTFEVDAASIVPAQWANGIARSADLVDETGWCPVATSRMQSLRNDRIHVIGDAARAAAMPKSAESAANQARLAGAAIVETLLDREVDRTRIANSCWSLIAKDDCVKIGGTYAPVDQSFLQTSSFISTVDEHPTVRMTNFRESVGWYRHITGQMFEGVRPEEIPVRTSP